MDIHEQRHGAVTVLKPQGPLCLAGFSFGAFIAGCACARLHPQREMAKLVLVGTAAETFNDGLRAYYFSFAAMAWFFSPVALVVATALVVMILYGREFHSEVLQVLRD